MMTTKMTTRMTSWKKMQDRGAEYANSPFLEADPWRIIYPSNSKHKTVERVGSKGIVSSHALPIAALVW